MPRRQPSLALLLLLDAVLIAAGFGVFSYFYTGVPHTYAEVPPLSRHTPVLAPTASSGSTATDAPAAPTVTAASQPSAVMPPGLTVRPTAAATDLPHEQPARSAQAERDLNAGAPTATVAARPAKAMPEPPRQLANAAPPTAAEPDLGNGKFADRFTSGAAEQTATSYRSGDINVTLTQVQRKGVTYYVQDIYIRHIENLRAAFARNKYGRSISQTTPDLANANGAFGAINGDWYGAGVLGAVIRNGVLYNGRAEGDVGVLYRDGTLRVFRPREFDARQAMADGAWQAWDFGPGLLAPEGQPIGKFNSGISGLNPRTAIRYYEPGHYAFVVVDGRQPGYSNGMTLAQLSSLFAEMGSKAAYNLDGGQTSVMTFGGRVVNRPYRNGRPTSDIVLVGE